MNSSIPLKQCSRKDDCINPLGSWLPATTEHFRKASKEKSGLTSRCKCCLHNGDASYRSDNSDEIAQKRVDNRDVTNAKFKEQYWNDPEYYRAKERDKHKANPEYKRRKASEYRAKFPDKVRSIKRDIYLRKRSDPDWWANELNRVKQYYIDHPEKKREHSRRAYENSIDKKRNWARMYYAMYPEKHRVKSHKRRARLKEVGGSYTDADLKLIYEELEGRCAYCGISIYWSIPRDIHVDHIKPISKGGSNNPDNLTLACHSCNESKADNELSDWLLKRGW